MASVALSFDSLHFQSMSAGPVSYQRRKDEFIGKIPLVDSMIDRIDKSCVRIIKCAMVDKCSLLNHKHLKPICSFLVIHETVDMISLSLIICEQWDMN
jgi:hypothetical protein